MRTDSSNTILGAVRSIQRDCAESRRAETLDREDEMEFEGLWITY